MTTTTIDPAEAIGQAIAAAIRDAREAWAAPTSSTEPARRACDEVETWCRVAKVVACTENPDDILPALEALRGEVDDRADAASRQGLWQYAIALDIRLAVIDRAIRIVSEVVA